MREEIAEKPAEEVKPLTAFAEKPKRKKRMGKRKARQPKLQKFDMVLLQLLKEGKSGLAELMQVFNVHEEEFRKRLDTLTKRKMVVLDEGKREVKLSVKGFNEFNPKWKQAADAWLGRMETKEKMEKKGAGAEGEKEEKGPKQEEQRTEQKKLSPDKVIEVAEERAPAPEERMDLMDVIKKYGPTDNQPHFKKSKSPFLERHPEPKTVTTKSAETKAPQAQMQGQSLSHAVQAMAPKNERENEPCELCKSAFVVSVNPKQHNPKYGHCFCGAAYHKDCYDAILQGERKCVRCGRKLVLAIDFKAEEAIGALKDVFE